MKFLGQDFLKDYTHPEFDKKYLEEKATWVAHPDWLTEDIFSVSEAVIKSENYKQNESFIWLLSPRDAQTGALIQKLKESKTPFIFTDVETLFEEGQVTFSNNDFSEIQINDQRINFQNATQVYYQAPEYLVTWKLFPFEFDQEEHIQFRRWNKFIEALPSFLPKANWFPGTPTKIGLEAQNRFSDLSLAKDLGFSIPETLFSNHLEKLKQLKNHKWLFRDWSTRVVLKDEDFQTFDIKSMSFNNIDEVLFSEAPNVFQEQIEKKEELRALVIGNKVLGCRIYSKSAAVSMDWRDYDLENTMFEATETDSQTKEKLVLLREKLGVQMISVDLLKTPSDELVFLEANRPGEWLFIEALTGLPVVDTISNETFIKS